MKWDEHVARDDKMKHIVVVWGQGIAQDLKEHTFSQISLLKSLEFKKDKEVWSE
jgi:hypothetical protein